MFLSICMFQCSCLLLTQFSKFSTILLVFKNLIQSDESMAKQDATLCHHYTGTNAITGDRLPWEGWWCMESRMPTSLPA
ncbi:hypothetical protein L6452_35253 [Arctium lappa]|uniref:Uncharacterized protein n=1 Tax=Arctium lappa TaxID=4217 RepID=A0ACB8Y7E5_ARCLA|nr:hypothetical protein L6452_35253 [Arctium lappa]